VNDAALVREVDRDRGVADRRGGGVRVERAAGEGAAVDEFHGDEGDAVRLADLVDLDDARVDEGPGGAGLALEPGELLGVDDLEELEGDPAGELRVPGAPDLAAAARAELLRADEAADRGSVHGNRVPNGESLVKRRLWMQRGIRLRTMFDATFDVWDGRPAPGCRLAVATPAAPGAATPDRACDAGPPAVGFAPWPSGWSSTPRRR
jgi:hypothetical protein